MSFATRTFFAASLLALGATACSSGPDYQQVTPSPEQKAQIGQFLQVGADTGKVFEDPASVVSSFGQIDPGAGKPKLAVRAAAAPEDVPACVTVAADRVTFACSADELQGVSVNGVVSRSGDTFTVDLRFAGAADDGSGSLSFEIAGSITHTPTLLDGRLSYDAEIEGDGGRIVMSYDVAFRDVVLSAACVDGALGGEVEAHAEASFSGGGANGHYESWAKAVFGPACGEMTFFLDESR